MVVTLKERVLNLYKVVSAAVRAACEYSVRTGIRLLSCGQPVAPVEFKRESLLRQKDPQKVGHFLWVANLNGDKKHHRSTGQTRYTCFEWSWKRDVVIKWMWSDKWTMAYPVGHVQVTWWSAGSIRSDAVVYSRNHRSKCSRTSTKTRLPLLPNWGQITDHLNTNDLSQCAAIFVILYNWSHWSFI